MCTWEGENWTAEKRSGETEEEEGRHGMGKCSPCPDNGVHSSMRAERSSPNHFLKSPTCQPYTGDPVLTHELCSTYSNHSKCEYVLKCGYECSHEQKTQCKFASEYYLLPTNDYRSLEDFFSSLSALI